ncbi:MAG: hypothetical protein JO111_08570 [Caulobacteraceae bacterium]|nr:hypothetical protein [Caulobacteraceae bacterium]
MRAGASLIALALVGCAGASVDRWSKVEGLPPYAPPVLTVSSAPAASADSSSVKALPERAEAAYVAAVAAKEKTTKDLQAALAKPIEERKTAPKDATVASRVLVVGVEREAPRPGDRLLSTIVSIRPAEPFRFIGYQQAATDRTFIDIGQVSITDQQSASIEGGTASATAKLEASRSRTASRAIRGESDLTVDVSPELVRIYRTGVEGRDLTGDTLVKLSLRLPQDDARTYALADADLRDDKGVPTAADKLRMRLKFISLAPAHDLWVCARLAYEDRAIVDGARSYDEGRQSVALKRGETPWTPYLVASAEELETPLWVVLDRSGGALAFDDGMQVNTLTFDDYDDAVAFLDWVQHDRTDRLANGRLVESAAGTTLPVRDFGALGVRRLPQTHGTSAAPTCG